MTAANRAVATGPGIDPVGAAPSRSGVWEPGASNQHPNGRTLQQVVAHPAGHSGKVSGQHP